jgi:hypothetical protein
MHLSLMTAPVSERPSLFREKLQYCAKHARYRRQDMAASEHIATQNKLQATLMELLEFGSTSNTQTVLADAFCKDISRMISANLFRDLPTPHIHNDPFSEPGIVLNKVL